MNTASVPSDYNSDLDTTECVDNSKDDDFSEDEAEIPAGVTDTMLTATDGKVTNRLVYFEISIPES